MKPKPYIVSGKPPSLRAVQKMMGLTDKQAKEICALAEDAVRKMMAESKATCRARALKLMKETNDRAKVAVAEERVKVLGRRLLNAIDRWAVATTQRAYSQMNSATRRYIVARAALRKMVSRLR